MPAADALAALAAVAVHGRDGSQEQAARELTRASRDPEAFTWWWLWFGSTTPEAAAPLVAELPRGLVLPPEGVPGAVDAMTGGDDPTCRSWANVRSAVLGLLDPRDPGSCDLATLVACDPGTHPDVRTAALALLAAAGHPSRHALLRAAEAALERAAPARCPGSAERPDAGSVVVAAAILAELAPPADELQRQLAARCAQLVEACAGHGDCPDESSPTPRRTGRLAAVLARLRS